MRATPFGAVSAGLRTFAHWSALLTLILPFVVACSQTQGTVRGVVIAVNGSLEDVTSFTVLVEGDEMTFVPVTDGDYPFPLPHLREHLRTGEPVLVTWKSDDGARIAVRIDDG